MNRNRPRFFVHSVLAFACLYIGCETAPSDSAAPMGKAMQPIESGAGGAAVGAGGAAVGAGGAAVGAGGAAVGAGGAAVGAGGAAVGAGGAAVGAGGGGVSGSSGAAGAGGSPSCVALKVAALSGTGVRVVSETIVPPGGESSEWELVCVFDMPGTWMMAPAGCAPPPETPIPSNPVTITFLTAESSEAPATGACEGFVEAYFEKAPADGSGVLELCDTCVD